MSDTNVAAPEQTKPVLSPKLPRANEIVKHHMWYCAGVGLIPVPVVDVLGITALQIKLVHDLAKHYEQDFNKEIVRSIISTLVAGLTTAGLASGTASLLRHIPLVGGILGFTTISLYAMGTTYAIGKVFTQHFESGGTLLTFNPEKLKGYFNNLYTEGREVAGSMLKNKKGETVPTPAG